MVQEAYEECGRGIGKMLVYAPEREPDIWAWLGGLKIFPRWYLPKFRAMWAKENPQEYRKIRERHYKRRLRKSKRAKEMMDAIDRLRDGNI